MGDGNDGPFRDGGDESDEPERGSVWDEAWREACRERWCQSEQAGADVGEAASRLWVRRHWSGFLRARWLEHLRGERFWIELDRADFGLARRVSAGLRPLLDEVLTRLGHGDENLHILTWARRAKTPEEQRAIFELLGLIIVNGHRLRCVFGNPFRPIVFDPKWRTEDVLGLALGIYEDCAFGRLPLLADVLMDAGCDAEVILAHCRSDGVHGRGCWVVDLVLDKN